MTGSERTNAAPAVARTRLQSTPKLTFSRTDFVLLFEAAGRANQ